MHISPAICRIGRVPSREAFRGSVITCSRNNERLILSSWLATPSSSSLSLSLSLLFSSKAPDPSRLIDLSLLCRFLRARVLWLSDLLYCIHVLHSFIHFSRSLSQRIFGRISRMFGIDSFSYAVSSTLQSQLGDMDLIGRQVRRGKPLY